MNASHRIRRSNISMPSYAIDIYSDLRITQLVDNTAPQIVVMIEDPDLGIQRCPFQSGPQVKRYENRLVLLRPHRRGKVAILVGIDLIVDGHGPNLHTSVCVCPEKFDKILSVSSKPAFLKAAPQH